MMVLITDKSKSELLQMLQTQMRDEQRKYRKWLIKQKKVDILKLAPHYYVREQAVREIIDSRPDGNMGDRHLYNEQISVFLRSRAPLAEICREYFLNIDLYSRYEFAESVRAAIDNCANDILRAEFLERRNRGIYTCESNKTYSMEEKT